MTKNPAKPPSTKRKGVRLVISAGTFSSHASATPSVRISITTTGASTPELTATLIASTSTSRIAGQTKNDTSGELSTGRSMSRRVSGGNHGLNAPCKASALPGCKRCQTTGNKEWITPKMK